MNATELLLQPIICASYDKESLVTAVGNAKVSHG